MIAFGVIRSNNVETTVNGYTIPKVSPQSGRKNIANGPNITYLDIN